MCAYHVHVCVCVYDVHMWVWVWVWVCEHARMGNGEYMKQERPKVKSRFFSTCVIIDELYVTV